MPPQWSSARMFFCPFLSFRPKFLCTRFLSNAWIDFDQTCIIGTSYEVLCLIRVLSSKRNSVTFLVCVISQHMDQTYMLGVLHIKVWIRLDFGAQRSRSQVNFEDS